MDEEKKEEMNIPVKYSVKQTQQKTRHKTYWKSGTS